MGRMTIEVDDELAQVLALLDQPPEQSARELIVTDLYRRALISSGKAAKLLGMTKSDFIQFSGQLGIPFFRVDDDALDAEVARLQSCERAVGRRQHKSNHCPCANCPTGASRLSSTICPPARWPSVWGFR